MRQDRHSRQLGRALSALAAAMADGERRDALVKNGDELLDRLMAA